MNQPVVLWVTTDQSLRQQVHARLPSTVTAESADGWEVATHLIDELSPVVCIVDLRTVNDGGHAGDRFIEDIQLRAEAVEIVLLTSANCPEMLDRRSACTPIIHLKGQVDPERVAEIIGDTLADRNPPPTEPPAATAPQIFGSHVLEGVTRKFETNSPQLKKILEDLTVAAHHDVTILLIGETGSGKTFLSSLIHEMSPRRAEPFLHLACGALPRELIESELFGHAKGSFTSAHADKEGKFVVAGKGTVLLDEIDVLGPEQQVKLLRVIETGEFEAVGSNRTLKSQARLVVASNLDLQPLVEQGKFRPDLYYRLSMLQFEIPPLRKRKIDIMPLAKKFIAKFTEKHHIPVHRIEDAFLDALLDYPWPGNVRELEHVIQRAVIYCRSGVLGMEQLPPHILAGKVGPSNDPSVNMPGMRASGIDHSLGQQVALTEREIIEQALFKNNFSRTKTAKDLGISRVTLYNKMKKYNMLKQ